MDIRAIEARLSLVLVLLQGGHPAAALVELDRAAEGAPRELRGQVLMQHAVIHIRIGLFEEALEDSRRALPLLRRVGDRLNEARVLSNRGVLHAYRGELARAETDLNKALQLYNLLERAMAAAQVLHNLGYVSALRGDVPGALKRYETASLRFTERGLGAAALSMDRAELLLSARLLPEARGQIDAVVKELEASGTSLDLAEARLLLSQVALAQGDLVVSTAAARAARRQLIRQGRSRWAALAHSSEAQSRWASGAGQDRVPAEAGALRGGAARPAVVLAESRVSPRGRTCRLSKRRRGHRPVTCCRNRRAHCLRAGRATRAQLVRRSTGPPCGRKSGGLFVRPQVRAQGRRGPPGDLGSHRAACANGDCRL